MLDVPLYARSIPKRHKLPIRCQPKLRPCWTSSSWAETTIRLCMVNLDIKQEARGRGVDGDWSLLGRYVGEESR